MRQKGHGQNYEMKSESAGRTGIRFVISCMHRRLDEAGHKSPADNQSPPDGQKPIIKQQACHQVCLFLRDKD